MKRGVPVRVNSAHSDLWLRIQGLCEEGLLDNVQLMKVVSHCSIDKATSPVEEWAYWHNELTDRAAAKINDTREPVFWETWKGLASALQVNRQLHNAILMVLLKTGRKAHMAEQQKGTMPAPKPRPLPVGLAQQPAAPVFWTFPERMVRRYRQHNVQMVHDWWSQVGSRYMEGDAPLTMVSGVQLFWDFFQATAYEGPWVHQKKWYHQAQQVPEAGRVSWGQRIKPFLLLWKAYLGCHSVKLPQKMTRPNSAAISLFLVCYRLRFPPERIALCDAAIFEQLGRQAACSADIQELRPARHR